MMVLLVIAAVACAPGTRCNAQPCAGTAYYAPARDQDFLDSLMLQDTDPAHPNRRFCTVPAVARSANDQLKINALMIGGVPALKALKLP